MIGPLLAGALAAATAAAGTAAAPPSAPAVAPASAPAPPAPEGVPPRRRHYVHPSELYVRFPIGDSGRAVNVFLSAQLVLTARLEAAIGAHGDEELVALSTVVRGPGLVLRDPWFSLSLHPVVSATFADPAARGSYERLRAGAEAVVVFNAHCARVPLAVRFAGGASFLDAPPTPWFGGGVDLSLLAGITFGLGVYYLGDLGPAATLSFGADIGPYWERAWHGWLFDGFDACASGAAR